MFPLPGPLLRPGGVRRGTGCLQMIDVTIDQRTSRKRTDRFSAKNQKMFFEHFGRTRRAERSQMQNRKPRFALRALYLRYMGAR